MKKVVLGLMFAYSCYASMPWETGWAMGGTSTYSIIDKNNNQLLLECNDMNKSIYLRDERRDNFKLNATIRVKLDDKEINILDGVDEETKSKDKFIWNDFINNLSKAKKILIYNNNKEYVFEPNNSDKIQDILDTCKINSETEQAKDTEKNIPSTPQVEEKAPIHLQIINYPTGMKGLMLTNIYEKGFWLKDIIVDNGNCKVNPAELNFAKSMYSPYGARGKIDLMYCFKVNTVEIKTSVGDYIFDVR
jgi:hypothetical protein